MSLNRYQATFKLLVFSIPSESFKTRVRTIIIVRFYNCGHTFDSDEIY